MPKLGEVHTMTTIETASTRPDSVLLIHGLWMSPKSWDNWIERYTCAGYRVVAPAWPRMEGTVEQLRGNTAPYDTVRQAGWEAVAGYALS
jgi:pimeloyl-ACP methyl ester carboxylesterase